MYNIYNLLKIIKTKYCNYKYINNMPLVIEQIFITKSFNFDDYLNGWNYIMAIIKVIFGIWISYLCSIYLINYCILIHIFILIAMVAIQ